MSKKLINQIKKTDKKLKQLLLEYSSSREQLHDEAKTSFQELTIDSVKRHETFGVDGSPTEINAVPLPVRRQAIQMLDLLKRSKEEKELLCCEMKDVYDYYLKDEAKVSKGINALTSKNVTNMFEAGSLALLKAEHKLLQNRVVSIHNSLKEIVTLPDIPFSTSAFEQHPSVEPFENNELTEESESENEL